MKIQLIGTGNLYSKYNSACTLVNEDLLVDVPNGVLKQLLNTKNNVEKIDKLLITHMHGDHTADIPFLLKYLYDDRKVIGKLKIIGPIGIENKVKELFKAFNLKYKLNEQIIYIELQENEIVYNSNVGYKIKAIPVLHGNEKPAYGYIIDEKLGLTGDSSICSGVENIVENSQVIIADCSRIEGTESHMGIDNLKYLSQKYKKTIIPTHMKDATRVELKNNILENILIKNDGYCFDL